MAPRWPKIAGAAYIRGGRLRRPPLGNTYMTKMATTITAAATATTATVETASNTTIYFSGAFHSKRASTPCRRVSCDRALGLRANVNFGVRVLPTRNERAAKCRPLSVFYGGSRVNDPANTGTQLAAGGCEPRTGGVLQGVAPPHDGEDPARVVLLNWGTRPGPRHPSKPVST